MFSAEFLFWYCFLLNQTMRHQLKFTVILLESSQIITCHQEFVKQLKHFNKVFQVKAQPSVITALQKVLVYTFFFKKTILLFGGISHHVTPNSAHLPVPPHILPLPLQQSPRDSKQNKTQQANKQNHLRFSMFPTPPKEAALGVVCNVVYLLSNQLYQQMFIAMSHRSD